MHYIITIKFNKALRVKFLSANFFFFNSANSFLPCFYQSEYLKAKKKEKKKRKERKTEWLL